MGEVSRWVVRGLVGYAVGCVVAGVLLAEVYVHMPRKHLRAMDEAQVRERVWKQFRATVTDVAVTAGDGSVLRGWFVEPPEGNGKTVVILHGIGDNRIGSAGLGDIFLAKGYAVLAPDSREHGESGGRVATYGIVERDDVRRWVDWVREREPGCTYLLGESMGAAIGLQATEVTPALCAAAVEDPYAGFREIAYERMGRETRLGAGFWRTVGRPVIESAIVYTRVRYGVNLPDAAPRAAVEESQVPTLLITGTADKDIPMHHAEELERVCASHCALWIVSGAGHGGASVVDVGEFGRRVVGWFTGHDGVATETGGAAGRVARHEGSDVSE